MNQPPFEVADIIRQYGNSFIRKHRSWLTWLHLRVLYAIAGLPYGNPRWPPGSVLPMRP